ncbi:hypothetical protein ENSA5_21490 [Enhygromyxa salina]|uniref:Uncharacterized protein n=1 Tax=Enhygromyxa salina TaxID=215803 RepID=A0A2S9YCP0_9BACT|nr:hypothetical protein [Enhygromyxa salina]PRQ02796.1 hypothetical protein ENSA5_21490 [Enhygromyxa salina]
MSARELIAATLRPMKEDSAQLERGFTLAVHDQAATVAAGLDHFGGEQVRGESRARSEPSLALVDPVAGDGG